jgi:hypothetical protein
LLDQPWEPGELLVGLLEGEEQAHVASERLGLAAGVDPLRPAREHGRAGAGERVDGVGEEARTSLETG